jgi:hypothetical protein
MLTVLETIVPSMLSVLYDMTTVICNEPAIADIVPNAVMGPNAWTETLTDRVKLVAQCQLRWFSDVCVLRRKQRNRHRLQYM